jgi:hypothetical protein
LASYSEVGRAARIILGLALITLGILSIQGTTGVVVAAVGLVPLAMGAWGRCLLDLVAPKPISRHA